MILIENGFSMKDRILLKVEGVSKIFCRDLKKSLWNGIRDIAWEVSCRCGSRTKLRSGEFWALKDISFRLEQGESLGLIGKNGAGKSTLLRLLNGLIKPNSGRIAIRGNTGALIELGAGFNPILTGRENIYINAAVLGIPKNRVNRIIDEIVDFAEIEEFIDSPVQNYSSGMKVRLGFAVAVQLNPDLMIIDEVLAVGDLSFRTKCLSRLNEMKKRGVSFILVSHNMTDIVQFTDRAILLEHGRLLIDGPSLEVSSEYTNRMSSTKNGDLLYGEILEDHPDLEHASVQLTSNSCNAEKDELTELATGQHAYIHFSFKSRRKLKTPNVSFPIYNANGVLITTIASVGRGIDLGKYKSHYSGYVKFGPININPGQYVLLANFHDGPEHLYRSVAATFLLKNSYHKLAWGLVDFEQSWNIYENIH